MALRFVVTASEGTVAGTYMDVLLEGEVVVVGRGEVDLMLPDPSVSLRQLEVRVVEEGWMVRDLDSRHGSRLNGTRLQGGQAVPLRVGDRIQAGVFCISFEGEQDSPGAENTRLAARSLVRRLKLEDRRGSEGPYLQVLNGPAAGNRLFLPSGSKLRLGRGRDCELMVDDARISRNHARIQNRGGAVWLEDAGSANGTWLDDHPVRGRARLTDGSRVRLGKLRLRLVVPRGGPLNLTAALGASREENLPAVLGLSAALLLGGLGLLVAVLL